MTAYYNKKYTINFTKMETESTKNSWYDFFMIPSSRPFVTSPKPVIIMAQLARSNKILDLTSSLYNGIMYNGSEGRWEFYIDHDRWNKWSNSYDALETYFDGTLFRVQMDNKDSTQTYIGILKLDSYAPGQDYSKITIAYNLSYLTETKLPEWITSNDPWYISLDKLPDKLIYDSDETVDLSGIKLSILNSRKNKYVDDKYTDGLVPINEIIVENPTITWLQNKETREINYKWYNEARDVYLSGSFTVSINKPSWPIDIQATTLPYKTDGFNGESIDLTGLVIKAFLPDNIVYTDNNYPDGIIPATELVIENSGNNLVYPKVYDDYRSVLSDQSIDDRHRDTYVRVRWTEPYHNHELVEDIKFVSHTDKPVEIEMIEPPAKTNYSQGEFPDLTGIVVKMKRYDGSLYTDSSHPDGIALMSDLISIAQSTSPYFLPGTIDDSPYTDTYPEYPRKDGYANICIKLRNLEPIKTYYVTDESGRKIDTETGKIMSDEYPETSGYPYNEENGKFLTSEMLTNLAPYYDTGRGCFISQYNDYRINSTKHDFLYDCNASSNTLIYEVNINDNKAISVYNSNTDHAFYETTSANLYSLSNSGGSYTFQLYDGYEGFKYICTDIGYRHRMGYPNGAFSDIKYKKKYKYRVTILGDYPTDGSCKILCTLGIDHYTRVNTSQSFAMSHYDVVIGEYTIISSNCEFEFECDLNNFSDEGMPDVSSDTLDRIAFYYTGDSNNDNGYTIDLKLRSSTSLSVNTIVAERLVG